MRKVVFFIILVIILVSITWFRSVMAQDLSSLSPEEIARLKAKYEQQTATTPGGPIVYQSPRIFDDTKQSKSYPNPSSGATPPDSAQTGFESGGRMPAFADLHPFGMELSRQAPDASPPSDIASADDYVLGPGDNVIVYLWGRIERDMTFVSNVKWRTRGGSRPTCCSGRAYSPPLPALSHRPIS